MSKKQLSKPELSEGVVHVWCAHLVYPDNALSDFQKQISADELSRSKRFIKYADQRKYVFGRAIVRNILARYLDIPPRQIEFQLSEHGKPYLPYSKKLQFNLSHAKDYLLVAMTRSVRVGIDIEYEKSSIDAMALAKRFFSITEYQALQRLSSEKRTSAFYRCWTRKEAFVKADGRGLTFPLSHFSVNVNETDQNALLAIHNTETTVKNWFVQSISSSVFPPQYYAALAVETSLDLCEKQPVITFWTYANSDLLRCYYSI